MTDKPAEFASALLVIWPKVESLLDLNKTKS